MVLGFPNPSRSYDPAGNRIRFWGHDEAFEVTFYLETGALLTLFPGIPNFETGLLAAFDAARNRIHEVAQSVYSPRARKAFYVLAIADFS